MTYELIDDEIKVDKPKIKDKSFEKAKAQDFKFFGYEPSQENIDKLSHEMFQKIAVPISRGATSALGMPGDILSVINKYIAAPASKGITGKESLPYEQTLVGKMIPGSNQLQEATEVLSGKKLKPETPTEEFLSYGMDILGGIFGAGGGKFLPEGKLPSFRKGKAPKNLPAPIRNIMASFIPASVLTGAEKADLPPWASTSAVVGTSMLLHRLTGKSVNQIKDALYERSQNLSKNVVIPTNKLEARLHAFEGDLSKGLSTAPKAKIQSLIKELQGKAGGGAIPLDDLIEARKNVNEVSKEFTKDVLKGSENYWSSFRQVIDNTIGDFEKLNPDFSKAYRTANSIHRGIEESKRIERFLTSHKSLSTVGGAALAFITKTLGVTSGGLPVLGGVKAFNFARALKRNPGLREAWKDVLKNASKNELKATAGSLRRFERYGKKEGLFDDEENEDSRFELID